jgi:lipopolysaccharide transport system ATP-binding protein
VTSSSIAVRLQSVCKKYRLFNSKRERILEALHPFRKTYHREFWALRDIDLEIPTGTTVGILGLNGSGKSTLLQIISSVLRPTSGTVAVQGRVAALLELGGGLNPELTGRENVLMNSAIMGFDRERTLSRMAEIETFADIGQFFDQPMKTYSSGMYMRVAFATSIFVDPDILIIDEALAVGDGKFAEKCYARIRKFREAGKTILIVTHDRTTVPRLCDLGVLLHRGRLVETGPTQRIVDLYTEIMAFGDLANRTSTAAQNPAETTGLSAAAPIPTLATPASAPEDIVTFLEATSAERLSSNPLYNKYEYRFGNGQARIDGFCVVQNSGVNPPSIRNDQPIDIYVRVYFGEAMEQSLIGFTVTSSQGVVLYSTHSGWLGASIRPAAPGETRYFRFSFQPRLNPGDWFVELAVAANQLDMCDVRSKVVHLTVLATKSFGGLAMLDTGFAEIPLGVGAFASEASSSASSELARRRS